MMTTFTDVAVSTSTPDGYEDFPFEVIHEGKPEAKVHWLRSSTHGEGQLMTGIFTVEPCRVDYEFIGDESLHLLAGRVTVEMEGGGTVSLKPGDIASFPKGAKSVWHIHESMKKFFVISG
jgi:uncharacterized cupin superfamily protein